MGLNRLYCPPFNYLVEEMQQRLVGPATRVHSWKELPAVKRQLDARHAKLLHPLHLVVHDRLQTGRVGFGSP